MRVRERVAHDAQQVPWIRHEHVERYRFAAGFVRDRVVVDCACGDATGTAMLAAAGAAFVHGFDLAEEAFAGADASGAPIRLATADARALPLPDASADVYVSLETIEHLDEADHFLEEVVRVLRPGGTFVCSTPNRYVYSPGHAPGARPWNRFHLREFDARELRELLGRSFEEVTLYGQNPRAALRARILNTLGRLLPFDLAVRLRQAAKLPLLLFDRPSRHEVLPFDDARPAEVLVAVCRGPRAQSPAAT